MAPPLTQPIAPPFALPLGAAGGGGGGGAERANAADALGGPSSAIAKRPLANGMVKGRRACVECHRAKSACEGGCEAAPCVRCVRLGKRCVTAERKVRRRRPATTTATAAAAAATPTAAAAAASAAAAGPPLVCAMPSSRGSSPTIDLPAADPEALFDWSTSEAMSANELMSAVSHLIAELPAGEMWELPSEM